MMVWFVISELEIVEFSMVEFTILELAEKIIDMTNSSSKIKKSPARDDDPLRRKPDITLAKKRLDWRPKIKLEEGLKKTINYFEELMKCI